MKTYTQKLTKLNSGLSKETAFSAKDLKVIDISLRTYCSSIDYATTDEIINSLFLMRISPNEPNHPSIFYSKCIKNMVNDYYRYNIRLKKALLLYPIPPYGNIDTSKIDMENVITYLKKHNKNRALYHLTGTIGFVQTLLKTKTNPKITKKAIITYLNTKRYSYNSDMNMIKKLYYGTN